MLLFFMTSAENHQFRGCCRDEKGLMEGAGRVEEEEVALLSRLPSTKRILPSSELDKKWPRKVPRRGATPIAQDPLKAPSLTHRHPSDDPERTQWAGRNSPSDHHWSEGIPSNSEFDLSCDAINYSALDSEPLAVEEEDDDDNDDDDDSSVEFLFVVCVAEDSKNEASADLEDSEDRVPSVGATSSNKDDDSLASLPPCSTTGHSSWTSRRPNPQIPRSDLPPGQSSEESEEPMPSEVSRSEPTTVGAQSSAASSGMEAMTLTPTIPPTMAPPLSYSPLTSAYVQSLAETAHIALHDDRWKTDTSVASKEERPPRSHSRAGVTPTTAAAARPLFRWEHGDDLSALVWFARRFLPQPPAHDEAKTPDGGETNGEQSAPRLATPCPCLLCRDQKATPPENSQAAFSTPSGAIHLEASGQPLPSKLEEEASDRSLLLYARLFYRKGPWFRLDDVFWKYYAKTRHNDVSLREISHSGSRSIDSLDRRRLEQHLRNLQNLVDDVQCLCRKGLMREFQDEGECGRAADSTLFTKDERTAVLAKLGVKKPSGKPNEIWTQMRTQRPIFGGLKNSKSSSSDRGILLPIRKHADAVLQHRFFRALLQSCSPNNIPDSVLKQHISQLQSRLGTFSTCFRLREAPTTTLQRCVRLFVCASAGPGDMRGIANGWASLRSSSLGDAVPPLARAIPPPCASSFHHVSHPGLSCRFGLRTCWFRESFARHARSSKEHAFLSRESFTAWEAAVELRAQVDYVLQLHETLRYNERRVKRGLNPLGGPLNSTSSIDFLGLLQPRRRKVVKGLLPHCSQEGCGEVLQKIDTMLEECWKACENPIPETEQVLIAIGVISVQILMYHIRTIDPKEAVVLAKRPWLRHLTWESVLAYILWDVIPLLERRELYQTATMALETLLFGAPLERKPITVDFSVTVFPSCVPHFRLANVVLTRRSRGKGFDRLIIDHNHLISQEMKLSADAKAMFKERRDEILHFCKIVVSCSLDTSLVTFSCLRSLARRLKRPLSSTIANQYCAEAVTLGLRYDRPEPENEQVAIPNMNRYADWTPTTDTAVANSLINQSSESNDFAVGRRCAFVGFEDDVIDSRSLNVEQLAMEYYRTGRFPLTHPDNESGDVSSHGWMGWHDEGTHVRALFRILCSPILGMDWFNGCYHLKRDCDDSPLLFLTPYQQAPYDLHVGFSLHPTVEEQLPSGKTCPGIFHRRRETIDFYLERLANLNAQELCDWVYASIESRHLYHSQASRKDPSLERDCQRLRTLSLIAAACGGSLLSRIFRCLLYDYRHYSGGLPDLLLVRGVYKDSNTTTENAEGPKSANPTYDGNGKGITEDDTALSLLVNLEEWIEEGTFLGGASTGGGASILLDDEFLGCSKVSDAPSGSSNRSSSAPGRGSASLSSAAAIATDSTWAAPSNQAAAGRSKTPALPPKLVLSHNNRAIRVECLLVEVKSSNDRLDGRQEDWLNILDHEDCSYSRARVCKFLKSVEPIATPATQPKRRSRRPTREKVPPQSNS